MSPRPCHGSEWRSRQPSGLKWRERTLNLVLGLRADAGASGEAGPVTGAQPEPERDQDQYGGDWKDTVGAGDQGEQDGGRAECRGDAGAGQAAALLLAGIAGHPRLTKYRGGAARPRSGHNSKGQIPGSPFQL